MSKADSHSAADLTGFEVVVAVGGGISAYKTCMVVSRLVQRGAGVTVAMTESAAHFVGPLTFQTLSGRKVILSLWDDDPTEPEHLRVTRGANLALVAPATANLMARMAHGMADDVVTALLISLTCPIVVAPAMNARMWANGRVQANVELLRQSGFHFVGPDEGWMACREYGVGRMAEPEGIVEHVGEMLKAEPSQNATLK